MTKDNAVVIHCRGHESVTATHAKTFELSTAEGIGPRATCVLGVQARVEGDLARVAGPVEITLAVEGHSGTVRVRAEGSPFAAQGDGLVVRKSDFRGADTLAVNADAGAADLDRHFVRALADPGARLTVGVRPLGPSPVFAVFTDDPATWRVAEDADEVVAATALGQLRACTAVAGGGDGDVLVLGPLPRGATARRARLAAALAGSSAVVVWQGRGAPPADLEAVAGAVAVDRGEAVTRITAQAPARIPPHATVTVAALGHPADDDLAPVLQALLAEGVSARTLRQALHRLPHLAGQWDYESLKRLR